MATTPPRKSVSRGASAGMLIVSGIVLGLLAGWGLGALLGAVVPLLLIGLFLGFAGGILAVMVRFRDL